MSDSMDLLFKIKADKEDASKKLEEVQGDVRKFRQEIINLTEELAKEKKLNINVEKIAELEGKIKTANTAMGESKKVMGLLRDEANALAEDEKKAADGLKDFANIENLKNVAQAFSQIGEQARELGKALISEAEEGKHFEQEIRNLSTSTKEAEQSLAQMKTFSDNNKILDDEDVLKVGAELVKFKLNVKDTLPLLADFAKAHQENITVPTDVVIKSLSGMRGGLQQLASQYGATKEVLAEYGAAVLASGELDKDDLRTKQAVIAWMKDQKGEYTELTKSTMEYERSVGDLRKAVGDQLIPMQIELNKKLLEVIGYFNSWSDSSKKTAISLAGLSIAGLAIGGTLAGIALQAASVVASIGSLAVAIGGTAGITTALTTAGAACATFTGYVIGIPVAIASVIVSVSGLAMVLASIPVILMAWQTANESIKNKDFIDGIQAEAKALQDLKKWYPEVTSVTEAYGLMQQKGIENILKEKDGHEQVQAVVKALALEERKLEDQRTEHQKLAQEYAKDTSDEGKKKLADQIAIISYLNETIAKLKGEKDGANEAAKAYDAKAAAASGGGLTPGGTVTDAQLSEELKRQNLLTETKKQSYDEQIRNLQNFQSTYSLEEMQGLTIEKEILSLQEKQGKEAGQAQKDNLNTQKDNWNTFIDDLKVALASGEVSQQQYNDAIAEYLSDNAKNLKDNATLKTSIESAYYSGVNKLQKDQEQEEKKRQAERKKDAAEDKRENDERYKRKIQAQAAELDAEGKTTEAKKKLLEIQEKDMRDKNLTEIEINEWKNAEIEKIDAEAAKKKEKLDQEKLAKTIEIEKQIVELRIKNSEKEIEIETSNIEIKKLIALRYGQDKITVEQEYQRDLHALELKSIDNFKDVEAEKTKAALLELDKKVVEWKKSEIDTVTIEKNIAQQVKNIQADVTADFLKKEEEKRKAIQDTYSAIEEIDKKIAANKEAQNKATGSSMGATSGSSPIQTMEQTFGKSDSKGYTDPLVAQWAEQKKLKDEENSLLAQKLKLETDLISKNNELIAIKDAEAQATKSLITSLDNASGSISNFSNSLSSNPPSSSETPTVNNTPSPKVTSSGTPQNLNISDTDKSGLNNLMGFISSISGSGKVGQGGNNPGSSSQGKGGNMPTPSFDDPANDSLAGEVGSNILLKNYQDMLKNLMAGSVKGLQSFASNISNISNSSQSNNNNYYMSGFNINNAPDNVKRGTQETVSWAMMQKYVKGK